MKILDFVPLASAFHFHLLVKSLAERFHLSSDRCHSEKKPSGWQFMTGTAKREKKCKFSLMGQLKIYLSQSPFYEKLSPKL